MDASFEDIQLPEGWVKCFSKTQPGKPYFFNTLTGESLWDHPEAMLLNEKKKFVTTTEELTSCKKEEGLLCERNSSGGRKRSRNEGRLKPLSKAKSGNHFRKGVKGDQGKVNVIGNSGILKKGKNFVKNSDLRSGKVPPSSIINGSNFDNKKEVLYPGKSREVQDKSKVARSERFLAGRKGFTGAEEKKHCHRESNGRDCDSKSGPSSRRSLQPLRPFKTQRSRRTNNADSGLSNRGCRTPKTTVVLTPKTPIREKPMFSYDNASRSCKRNGLRELTPTKGLGAASHSDIAMTEAEGTTYHRNEADMEMEVDDAGFMAKEIFRQIQDIRLDRIIVPRTTGAVDNEPLKVVEGSLHIVLDTNILLAHLKFVSELKDSPIPGAGRPTIVIPWMVVQELDRLKSAPDSRKVDAGEGETQPGVSINLLARNAIAFLHDCFSHDHPRIKGQSVVEASQTVEGLREETNDDSILCCCLLIKQRASQTKTVLLSNDRNLCSKALMNGVKAFTKKTLLQGLQDLFQSGNIIIHKAHFKEFFQEAKIQERKAEQQRKADDLICELQCILREALAAVVEQEMKDAYGNMWLEIVKIKPPWTLIDTFELLEKHWVAVFGHVVNRSLKVQVTGLKKKFLGGQDVTRDLNLAGEMIHIGVKICEAFMKHSSYNDVLPKCLAASIFLQRTWNRLKMDETRSSNEGGEVEPAERRRPLPQPPDGGAISDGRADDGGCAVLPDGRASTSAGQSEDTKPPHLVVMITFDEIWKAVRMLSSSIFQSMEYPNPYQDCDDNQNLKPSKEESQRFLLQLVPCLGRLVQGIQRVLGCPLEDSHSNQRIFTELGESIAQFLKIIMCRDCQITLEDLFAFCIDSHCRNALVQGMSQLDRAFAMLQHCQAFGAKPS